jgi:hypothetical protein
LHCGNRNSSVYGDLGYFCAVRISAHLTPESDEQSDGPKRWIGRFLMENLLATARSSVSFDF